MVMIYKTIYPYMHAFGDVSDRNESQPGVIASTYRPYVCHTHLGQCSHGRPDDGVVNDPPCGISGIPPSVPEG